MFKDWEWYDYTLGPLGAGIASAIDKKDKTPWYQHAARGVVVPATITGAALAGPAIAGALGGGAAAAGGATAAGAGAASLGAATSAGTGATAAGAGTAAAAGGKLAAMGGFLKSHGPQMLKMGQGLMGSMGGQGQPQPLPPLSYNPASPTQVAALRGFGFAPMQGSGYYSGNALATGVYEDRRRRMQGYGGFA